MTDKPLNHSKPTPRGRRGSIYAVVLAMAILVSLIGLSAVAVGRINLRSASGVGDSASAELLALSAVEHGIAALNSEAGWRSNTTYFTEQKTPAIRLGTGSFCWKLRDELDGDIQKTVGGIQPVRLFGIGSVGEAKRVYSVVLVPTGTNLLTNPGFESGTTPFVADAGACVLEVVSTDVRNGLRSLSVKSRVSKDAGPLQDMTAKLTDNKWYYLEAWVKMSTTPEEPVMTLVLRKAGSNDRFIRRPATQTAQKAGIEWTKIGYSFKTDLSSGGSFDNAYWRIETASTTQDFMVDDVKLIEETGVSTPMPMAPARETWKQEQGE